MKTLVWLHEDSMRADDAALEKYPGSPAVFVFDREQLAQQAYSLKRVQFIYECLLETPVRIVAGPATATLLQIAREEGCGRVASTWSVNPFFREVVGNLERHVVVDVCAADRMIPADLHADLRRFSRFWRAAEPYAFGRKR